MKKLMIAAAAAAMICGVEASDLAYDFTATLKTTVGKKGSTSTTYWVSLGRDGMDEDAIYWWKDLGWSTEKLAKQDVGYLVKDKVEKVSDECIFSSLNEFLTAINYTKTTDKNKIETNAYGYPEYYRGKIQWCYQFSFKETDGGCYRAAGSYKIKDVFFTSDCCNDLEMTGAWGDTIKFAFINRFGSVASDKATKVEAVGCFNDYVGDDAVSQDYVFSFAGQGTWKNNLYKDSLGEVFPGVDKISGNIVGVLVPWCEECCDSNTIAQAFVCNEEVLDDTLSSAAYGNFTLKFNKKNSDID